MNWLMVGEAEQARRAHDATQEMIDVLDWLHENGGTFRVAQAAVMYAEHLAEIVRLHGGTIITERRGHDRHGRLTTTRTIQRFPHRVAVGPPRIRCTPRRRGAGRPRAHSARSSAASGDSGDAGGGEPEPGEPRPAATRAVVVPAPVRRYVVANALGIQQVRWCDFCGVIAPAVDDYQRQALDRVGFTTLCPDCGGER